MIRAEATEYYPLLDATATSLPGCVVELREDGSVMLVIDGERLFRFDSFEVLLAQYRVAKGDETSAEAADADTLRGARSTLVAAELAAGVAMAGLHRRPRAHKAIVENQITHAIERLRRARAQVQTLATTLD